MDINKIPQVLESLKDVVIVGDDDMVVSSLSETASAFFGYTNEEVRGRSVTVLLPNHGFEPPSSPVIMRARHKNGGETPVVVQTTRDALATTTGWVVIPFVLPPSYHFALETSFASSISNKLSMDDIDFKGRRTFVRVDFNVPIDKRTNKVLDTRRIEATLPTLRKILGDGGRVIIGTHLGRPKSPKDQSKSVKPLIPIISEIFGVPVQFAPDALKAYDAAHNLKDGEILMLENLRYHKAESSKTLRERHKMAAILSTYCDLYVSDAFGTAHRSSASMTGLPRLMGAGIAGYLMEKEVRAMSRVMSNPHKPVLALVGGSKVSDKIALLGNIFKVCNTVFIGGAMAFTFLECQGYDVGNSKVERVAKLKGREIDLHDTAKALLKQAEKLNVRVVLPVDFACAAEFKDVPPHFTKGPDVPKNLMALDMGPKSIENVLPIIKESRTILWNGPQGVFELSNYSKGSLAVAKAIAENKDAVSIVGGGETAACASKFKSGFSHISTGGGATLELLEGKPLPGLVALTSRREPKL